MIESRKEDHIEICSKEDVEIETDYFRMIKFFHKAAPEVDLDNISIETDFLGKKIRAPIMVSAITGGYEGANEINKRLASSTEEVGIPLGVGSQRPALEDEGLRKSYETIREFSPPIVIGNIGAPQLIEQGDKPPFGVEEARAALDMINGDHLAVHFNFLQEVIQPEGDHDAEGILEALSELTEEVSVIAKETGGGISSDMAQQLKDTGVKAIDVGGMGGTSFSAVEYFRTKKRSKKELAEELWDWGIPTPASILECRKTVDLPLIATGGIRNGVQAAKAIALGADVAGIAGGVLPYVTRSKDDTVKYLQNVIEGLKSTMFLLGCETLEDLRKRRVVITGELRDWSDFGP